MEPMAKHPWLLQRRDATNRFYLRAKVPADLVEIIGKREIKKSLGTPDRREAIRKLRLEAVAVEQLFDDARRELEAQSRARSIEECSETDLKRMVLLWFHVADQSQADSHFKNIAKRVGVRPSTWLDAEEWALTKGTKGDTRSRVEAIADCVLEDNSWRMKPLRVGGRELEGNLVADVDKTSKQYELLCELVHRALLEIVSRSKGRLEGKPLGHGFDVLFADVGAGKPRPATISATPKITLFDLIEEFMAEPQQTSVSEKTIGMRTSNFSLLRAIVGSDTLVQDITRDDLRRVRGVLTKLPPNASKRFPNLSPEEAAAMADKKGLKPLSVTSVNSYLGNYAAVFRYAMLEHGLATNLVEGLRLRGKRAGYTKRRSFTVEELNKLFRAPLYVGCKNDERSYTKRGPNKPRRGRFWVPLISLFTGMRMEEICQLDVSDVAKRSGVDVIMVREGGDKSLKSEAAERVIPIHPELRKIGFLKYVAAIRKAGETKLFPDLPPGRRGRRGDKFSKWFGRFSDTVGVTDKSVTFHSFRHTFKDALSGKVPLDVIDVLCGWSNGRMADKYGSGPLPPILAKAMAKVRYSGLDLRHLYPR
jgi:integrase